MKLSVSQLLVILTASVATAAAAENSSDYECVGTFIFGRHNDRNVKPAVILSPLGARHQYDMGSFFRKRYYGLDGSGNEIDSDYAISGLNEYGLYQKSEFYGQAPSSNVIFYSHMSFLQGLYPPTTVTTSNDELGDTIYAELSNGTDILGPLGGYQYVQSYIQEPETPDYIWIKGDEDCTKTTLAMEKYLNGTDFQKKNESTLSFYQNLRDIIPTSAFEDWELNYGNAMQLFDYMEVNSIHNETLEKRWNDTILAEVRILSDQYNFLTNYDVNNKTGDLSIGARTMAGAILSKLNTTKVEQLPLINYFTGSFNTMFQLFGLLDLYKVSDNFTGMPDYGSALVWELLKKDDEHYVQFSFKNGSTSPIELETFPLFDTNKTILPWDTFVSKMEELSISSLESWCEVCSASVDMCTVYSDVYEDAEKLEANGVSISELEDGDYSSLNVTTKSNSSLSLADAGGIGAGVTIGVFLLLGLLVLLYVKFSQLSKKKDIADLPVAEKRVSNNSLSDATV